MNIFLTFVTKYWKYVLAAVLVVGLLGTVVWQKSTISSLESSLSLEKSGRANDKLVYESNLGKIESERQRVLNEVNALVAEKERVINESWSAKLKEQLNENSKLETLNNQLSANSSRLLNDLNKLRASRGSQSSGSQSGSQLAGSARSGTSVEWDILQSCIQEYSIMARDADRVVQDFRLLNDWKESIIIKPIK